MYSDIPEELREGQTWLAATGEPLSDGSVDKKPRNPRTGKLGDVTDRSTCGTFDEVMRSGMPLPGRVVTRDDPYTVIDLDHTDDPALRARNLKVIEAFGSYTEISLSGKGVHIWVKGKIADGGRRANGIEVYSQDRYVICTGNVLVNAPIAERQELLDKLVEAMPKGAETDEELVQVDSDEPDDSVIERLRANVNGDKFERMFTGGWEVDFNADHSRADDSLFEFLTWASQDNNQCLRIFYLSVLGKRKKAYRKDYVMRSLRRGRAHNPIMLNFDALLSKQQLKINGHDLNGHGLNGHSLNGHSVATVSEPAEAPAVEAKPAEPLAFPPGFVGELADYFMASSIRPVREMALVAAIGAVAGVIGRAYNISRTGLNQYLCVVAPTGSGKDDVSKSIDRLFSAVSMRVPSARSFIGPAGFASGQGLVKTLDSQPCFVSILGEFGLVFKEMSDQHAPAAVIALKRNLLSLYGKSGFNDSLQPTAYSKDENSTKWVQSPAVSLIGETTPDTFYKALDASAITHGVLPRFIVVEYKGKRPRLNPNIDCPPSAELCSRFEELLVIALKNQQARTFVPIPSDDAASKMLREFNEYIDDLMDDMTTEAHRELWNRAHLKALKLAGLVAVGVNPHSPMVTTECARWAIAFVCRDTRAMIARFQGGEIGTGDKRMEYDFRCVVDAYLAMDATKKARYAVPEKLLGEAFFTYAYLRRRLLNYPSFEGKLGFNQTLTNFLKAMVNAEVIIQLPSARVANSFGVRSPVYGKGPNW